MAGVQGHGHAAAAAAGRCREGQEGIVAWVGQVAVLGLQHRAHAPEAQLPMAPRPTKHRLLRPSQLTGAAQPPEIPSLSSSHL